MPYEHDAPPPPPPPRRFGAFAPLAWSWQGAVIAIVMYLAVALATGLEREPGTNLLLVLGCLVAGRILGWAFAGRSGR